MNLNKMFVPAANVATGIINSRARLNTGTHCNYKCPFCYYIDSLDDVKPFNDILKDIEFIKESNINEIDLSGGESSIHNRWFDILDACSSFDNISTLSNGSMFQDIEFLKKSQKHGLNEILFSLHGWDSISHDKSVGHVGAFKDIMQSIKNANMLNIIVRINCTVSMNFEPVAYYTLINSLKIKQLNLLPLNYWGVGHQKVIDYNVVSRKIHTVIDNVSKSLNINVRYIPFCYMRGYEKYTVGTYQHIYDLKDWNFCTWNNLSNNKMTSYEQGLLRRDSYTKPKDCLSCKHLFICDGVENKLIDTFIPLPEDGQKIKNIMEYRNGIINFNTNTQ